MKRKKISAASYNMRGISQSGYFFEGKETDIALQSYKSFRVRQFLQHISRQIYYYLLSNSYDPVEIEVLYLAFNNSLYISENHINRESRLFGLLSKKDLLSILCQDYSESLREISNINDFTVDMAIKTAWKMNRVIEDPTQRMHDFSDDEKIIIMSILEALRPNEMKKVESVNDVFKNAKSSVIVFRDAAFKDYCEKVHNDKSLEHAELHLKLIVDFLHHNRNKAIIDKRAWLYGKKRPCLTCFSELNIGNYQSFFYSPRPGRFFEGQTHYLTDPAYVNVGTLLSSKCSMYRSSGLASSVTDSSPASNDSDNNNDREDASESDSDSDSPKI